VADGHHQKQWFDAGRPLPDARVVDDLRRDAAGDFIMATRDPRFDLSPVPPEGRPWRLFATNKPVDTQPSPRPIDIIAYLRSVDSGRNEIAYAQRYVPLLD